MKLETGIYNLEYVCIIYYNPCKLQQVLFTSKKKYFDGNVSSSLEEIFFCIGS